MKDRKYITPIGDEGIYILDTGSWRNFRPVISREKCNSCGICFTYCPVNSIFKEAGQIKIGLQYCKGCGICAVECPGKAIDIVKEGGEN